MGRFLVLVFRGGAGIMNGKHRCCLKGGNLIRGSHGIGIAISQLGRDFRVSCIHALRELPHGLEHLRKLPRVRQGSNVLHESRQLGTILRLSPSPERFSRVNVECFVLEQRVQTDDK